MVNSGLSLIYAAVWAAYKDPLRRIELRHTLTKYRAVIPGRFWALLARPNFLNMPKINKLALEPPTPAESVDPSEFAEPAEDTAQKRQQKQAREDIAIRLQQKLKDSLIALESEKQKIASDIEDAEKADAAANDKCQSIRKDRDENQVKLRNLMKMKFSPPSPFVDTDDPVLPKTPSTQSIDAENDGITLPPTPSRRRSEAVLSNITTDLGNQDSNSIDKAILELQEKVAHQDVEFKRADDESKIVSDKAIGLHAWTQKLPSYIAFITAGIKVLDDKVLFNELVLTDSDEGIRHEGNMVAHPANYLDLASYAVDNYIRDGDDRKVALHKLIVLLKQKEENTHTTVNTEFNADWAAASTNIATSAALSTAPSAAPSAAPSQAGSSRKARRAARRSNNAT